MYSNVSTNRVSAAQHPTFVTLRCQARISQSPISLVRSLIRRDELCSAESPFRDEGFHSYLSSVSPAKISEYAALSGRRETKGGLLLHLVRMLARTRPVYPIRAFSFEEADARIINRVCRNELAAFIGLANYANMGSICSACRRLFFSSSRTNTGRTHRVVSILRRADR